MLSRLASFLSFFEVIPEIIRILAVTDKQYGDILNFWGKSERAKPEIPQQLEFF